MKESLVDRSDYDLSHNYKISELLKKYKISELLKVTFDIVRNDLRHNVESSPGQNCLSFYSEQIWGRYWTIQDQFTMATVTVEVGCNVCIFGL